MIKININIVGTFSRKDDIYELENVAKLFLVEERVKVLTYNINDNKNEIKNSKIKISTENKQVLKTNNIFSVKGLN